MTDPREDPKDTLCIYCRLAVHGNCNWRRDFSPVDGWTVVENPRGEGCHVQECPLFEVGRGLPRQIDNDGMLAILEACALQMRDDYIHGLDYHGKEEDEHNKKSEYNALVRKSKRMSISPEKMKIDAEIRAINRKRIESWIRGDGARLLLLQDPEALIKYLRKQARIHEERNAQLLMSIR